MKTSELIGTTLKIAVAKADNRQIRKGMGGSIEVRGRTEDGDELPEQWDLWMNWNPATNWEQGGPIIEREFIHWSFPATPHGTSPTIYLAYQYQKGIAPMKGPTPLIAAMRCYVASKLSDEVEIPKELM